MEVSRVRPQGQRYVTIRGNEPLFRYPMKLRTILMQEHGPDSYVLPETPDCVFGRGGIISPAVVLPVLGDDRRQFDFELQLQVNLPY